MIPTINLKKELGKIGLGLLYIVFIIFIIRYFQLSKWYVIGLLFMGTLGFKLISFIKDGVKPSIKELIFVLVYLTLLINLMAYLGKYGAYGYIASIIIIVVAILWNKRKKYMEVKHYIESRLWGKPLYEFRKQNKKPPKIQIVR